MAAATVARLTPAGNSRPGAGARPTVRRGGVTRPSGQGPGGNPGPPVPSTIVSALTLSVSLAPMARNIVRTSQPPARADAPVPTAPSQTMRSGWAAVTARAPAVSVPGGSPSATPRPDSTTGLSRRAALIESGS